MKKRTCCLLIVIMVSLLLLTVVGCSYQDYATEHGVDLFDNATYTNAEGNNVKSIKGNQGDYIDIRLGAKTTFNTIVLSENKKNVVDFKLYYQNDNGEMVFFYQSDLIEQYRYCATEVIITEKLRIEVVETKDNASWSIKRFSGYLVEKTADENFRIVGYARTGFNYNTVDTQAIEALTQVNLIGSLHVNSQSELYFEDCILYDNNGSQTVDGEQAFAKELAMFRQINGDRKYIATILGKEENMNSGQVHTAAMKNSDKFIDGILALIEKYDLDGVALDYEYPSNAAQYKVYGDFVKKLKSSLPQGKLLSLAMASWQFSAGLFPKSALDSVDQIEMMAYDMFDKNGYHSTFETGCYSVMKDLARQNMTKYLSKINLGIPFYSRPTDGYAYWGDYRAHVEQLGKYGNILKSNIEYQGRLMEYQYFNSYQMVYDKTAFAIDNSLGGVMIWHINCDVAYSNELSLLRAMTTAKVDRMK